MKLRCVIVDDEKPALDFLEDNISRIPYLQLIGRCRNALEAGRVLQSEKVDLIILDIQMPGLNGLQFVEQQFSRPLVIFVTAYDNYALEAFNVDAIDYLVKPVAFERFLQAVNKALLFSSYQQSSAAASLSEGEPEFIFVNIEYNLVKVELAEILYIEGLKDYIRLNLRSEQRPLLTRLTMKGMQELLPERKFIRIHRSFIVAVSAIAVIKKDTISLKGVAENIPISYSYKENINAILGNR